MFALLIFFHNLFPFIISFNFNYETVQIIENPAVDLHSHFGYSVMLQSDDFVKSVIIGAPKKISASEAGGGIFRCDLQAGQSNCTKYKIPKSDVDAVDGRSNGNWLGSVISGESGSSRNIYTCAPRALKKHDVINYYINGVCYKIDFYGAINRIEPFKGLEQTRGGNVYVVAFGEVGFDFEYNVEGNRLVFGAPGFENWNGIALEYFEKTNQIGFFSEDFGHKRADYLGFKIAAGFMNRNNQQFWIVAGKPRGNKLFGSVIIFESNNRKNRVISTLSGVEVGAYFGATLLIGDYNNDGFQDLLIGAPMTSGKTYDEGCVYFYSHQNSNFDLKSELTGSKAIASRFGSVMANIGDLDHDGYNDVAISAPFENDRAGAVYIYMGSKEGLTNKFAQKIEPSSLLQAPSKRAVGFGLGVSKGLDIDDDGFLDIAIGAYKSDQVYVIKSKQIVDYELELATKDRTLKIDAQFFNVKYCLRFVTRKNVDFKTSLEFVVKLVIDRRGSLINSSLVTNMELLPREKKCMTVLVSLNAAVTSFIRPFEIDINCNSTNRNIIGIGEPAKLIVPFNHGCGDDRICQTNLTISTSTTTPKIIHSITNEVDINVAIQNSGEPAYDCQLIINASDAVVLRNVWNCNKINGSYTCPCGRLLKSSVKYIPLKFDINKLQPHLLQIQTDFFIKSSGDNVALVGNFSTISIPVEQLNHPYIEGKSTPENLQFDSNKNKEAEVVHTFAIGNFGPSPVKLDLIILVPKLFQFSYAQSSYQNIKRFCIPLNNTHNVSNRDIAKPVLSVPDNRTISVDCFGTADCIEIYCDGTYLYKSETAEYSVGFTIDFDAIVKTYGEEFLKRDIISFTTTAVASNATHTISAHSTSLVYVKLHQPVPIWIYVVSSVLGLLCLILLVLILYKCHFFDRKVRDKLAEEILMSQNQEELSTADKKE